MAMNEEKYNILSGSAAALNHRDEEEKTGMDEENEVPDEAEEEKKTKKFNIAVVGRAIKKFFYETIAYPMGCYFNIGSLRINGNICLSI